MENRAIQHKSICIGGSTRSLFGNHNLILCSLFNKQIKLCVQHVCARDITYYCILYLGLAESGFVVVAFEPVLE